MGQISLPDKVKLFIGIIGVNKDLNISIYSFRFILNIIRIILDIFL